MAVLPDADRAAVNGNFMQELSDAHTPTSLLKSDLRAAVNAIDDWVNANAVAFNLAIPLPARTQLTAKQKAQILFFVVRRRFEVS